MRVRLIKVPKRGGLWQDDGMDWQIFVTVIAGILLVVAVVGTVYPVLPGSLLVIVTLLVWAWVMGSWPAWTAAVIGALLAAVGWSASTVLTGRKLKELQVPKRSIAVALVAGVVGMFLIPLVGLFVGFGAGLLLSEYVRHRDHRAALASSAATLKATGTGLLIEFGMACLAGSVWAIGVIAHFLTR
jgi:uncharacterized protein YqgC (DUF456 family)